MKRALAAGAVLFALAGCGAIGDEDPYAPTAEDKEAYVIAGTREIIRYAGDESAASMADEEILAQIPASGQQDLIQTGLDACDGYREGGVEAILLHLDVEALIAARGTASRVSNPREFLVIQAQHLCPDIQGLVDEALDSLN